MTETPDRPNRRKPDDDTPHRDRPSPEIRAERKRIVDRIGALIDEVLLRRERTISPTVKDVFGKYAADLAELAKFVREGE